MERGEVDDNGEHGSPVVLLHECVTPTVTKEHENAATGHASDTPLAWWRCPECGTSWYLARWWLTGGVFWHEHVRRWDHAHRRPKRTKKARWWRRKSGQIGGAPDA